MKKIKIVLAIFLLATITSCEKMLDKAVPQGVLTEEQATQPEQIESFVVSAYAGMPRHGFANTHAPWIQSVRSDDSYKGGGGLSDQTPWHEMEIFTALGPNTGNNDGPWYQGYVGISRCNTAINLLNNVDAAIFPMKEQRLAEMKFLRGWIYLGMKLRWKYVPIITDTTLLESSIVETIGNRKPGEANDLYLWDFIIKDFEEAAAVLPETQGDKGRPTMYAAHAFAAKALLFRAYEQDDRHQVVNINIETLNKALAHVDIITQQDGVKFDLEPDFANNFLIDYDNNTKESLWEIQYSMSDGTTDGFVNRGDELNAPWWTPYFSCCDFHKVSYSMINAFKTDGTGLPDFENYNETEFPGNAYVQYFQDHSFDPRLGHTVAIPGYPWKYNNSLMFAEAGSRAIFQYGYFNSMKEQVDPNCACLFKPFYIYNSMNKKEIRYAEVLLWKAEILIQLNRETEALPLINRIRERAANSLNRLRKSDGSLWMDYTLATYQPGVNCTWTKDFAMEALQWENRLETSCEGRRFFDLLRWGILEPTMNAHFEKERPRFDWFNQAHFNAGRDEYLPIPQAQMNFARGSYTQNPGF
jgi:hypothetical protein